MLRRYRDATNVKDYIDTVTALVAPPDPLPVPPSVSALDIAYAIGYLDWSRSVTRAASTGTR